MDEAGNTKQQNDFIERRSFPRKSMALRVSLYYDQLGLVSCKTRNLCLEGTLIDTGRVRLSRNTHVELVVTDLVEDYSDPIRLSALVCRVNESHAALTFRNFEVSTLRRLKTLLARRPRET